MRCWVFNRQAMIDREGGRVQKGDAVGGVVGVVVGAGVEGGGSTLEKVTLSSQLERTLTDLPTPVKGSVASPKTQNGTANVEMHPSPSDVLMTSGRMAS